MIGKLIVCLYAIFALSACCTDKYTQQTNTPVFVDSRILAECKDFVEPDSPLTFEGILKNVKDNSIIHQECKQRHSDAIKVINKFSNQQDKDKK